MNGWVRFLLIAGGTASVGVGIVGIFVPLLPTTPFLLLAAVLYSRSSDRLSGWLLGNRWFGAYVRRYRERRSMSRRHKAFTLALLWGAIGSSAALVVTAWWGRLILAIVAVGVTVHVLLLGTESTYKGYS